MLLSPIDPSTLPGETVERRLAHAKYSEDPNVLQVLSVDRFWFVRDYVAANTKTPVSCLQLLLKDPDFRVKTEAERTLAKLASRGEASFSELAAVPGHEHLPLANRIEKAAGRAAVSATPTNDERFHSR